jgi:5-(carboxyamino)imidazole ribonucleotide mutase
MKSAASVLDEFGVPHEMKIVSAHRTPDDMADYAKTARAREG